jgi:hypothetical protein
MSLRRTRELRYSLNLDRTDQLHARSDLPHTGVDENAYRQYSYIAYAGKLTFFHSARKNKGESEDYPITRHRMHRAGVEVQLYSFLNSALDGGGWSTPRPSRLTFGIHCRG